ncbi:hypothetical protein RSP822_17180 [Ralstonia solanacearum]|uniref:DUF3304 domain-containing protein n=1 Tax=Ralstonia solanacearum TaxID=305 RepID=UPI000E66BC03|nr:DUF3304 domain-containing protein [Ralstonia solanacearum]RIJ85170.1 hypothetical protein RSP822_17180 [Ralstonia solanacearum]
MKTRTWIALVLVLLATLIGGCKPAQQAQAQAAPEDEEIGAQVRVLNYMDEGLGEVYVNGVWVGGTSSHSGGHSVAGAIGLPPKWHSGLTVEVEWQDDSLYRKDHDAMSKTRVPVATYDVKNDYPAALWLAFMPDKTIKAIASSYGPGHVKFPADWKYPEDVCMANAECAARFYSQHAGKTGQEH